MQALILVAGLALTSAPASAQVWIGFGASPRVVVGNPVPAPYYAPYGAYGAYGAYGSSCNSAYYGTPTTVYPSGAYYGAPSVYYGASPSYYYGAPSYVAPSVVYQPRYYRHYRHWHRWR